MPSNQRGTAQPVSQELLQRLQNIERILGITGQNNGPGYANSSVITGNHTIWDTAGNLRAQVGLLPSGDYGYMTRDPVTGVLNEIYPTSSNYANISGSTSSLTPVSLAGSPTVSCYIGASGDALVTVCVDMTCQAGDGAEVNLVFQSATVGPDTIPGFLGLSSSATVTANVSSTRRITEIFGQLPQNTEVTFSLSYQAVTAGPALFKAVGLIVLPL